MAEYSRRDAAIAEAEYDGNFVLVVPAKKIRNLPSADVIPVRHGMWIDLGDNYWERGRTSTRYKCSECGRRAGQKQAKLYHYCPNCGCRMDGGIE